MKNKKFYIASLVLLSSAFVVLEIAKGFASESMLISAKSLCLISNQKDLTNPRELAGPLSFITLVLAAAGILSWLISIICNEPVRQFVPLILLIILIIVSILTTV